MIEIVVDNILLLGSEAEDTDCCEKIIVLLYVKFQKIILKVE
jgi:hypothetical protein